MTFGKRGNEREGKELLRGGTAKGKEKKRREERKLERREDNIKSMRDEER